MRQLFFFLLILVAGGHLIVSCSGDASKNPGATDSSEIVHRDTFDLSFTELETDTIPVGSVIILKGYIGDPGAYVTQSNGYMSFPFFARRNQRAGFYLDLRMKTGTESNHVHELPAEFLPEDFKVVTDNGSIVTRGAFVEVIAIKGVKTGGIIPADVVQIHALEAMNFMPFLKDSVAALTSEIIQDSSIQYLYCFLEGKLEIPEIIFSYTNAISLDLSGTSVKEITTVEIPLGDGPSSMNDLPDNYTDADLVLRDYAGLKIPYGSKVRLYGTWERNAFDSTFPGKFYLEEIEVAR